MARKPANFKQIAAQNRKAHYDYFIDEVMEAGIVLTGTEVKSIRENKASINEAFAEVKDGEAYLINANIPEYNKVKFTTHYPRAPRKLLLHKKQIKKLIGYVQKKGFTLVPLSIYFNNTGRLKVELAVVRGKKDYDKRETIKQRDWDRRKASGNFE